MVWELRDVLSAEIQFLEFVLSRGPQRGKDILKAGKALGYSKDSLIRARHEAGLIRKNYGRHEYWELPGSDEDE